MKRLRFALLGVACICSIGAALRADVPDPDTEVERKGFKIADGFEINLFACDPMVQKPIEMNWDTRGRLWCGTSETYPQLKPGEKPNDKIFILEDTQGAGKADKSTVFADGLFIPNAVTPGDGGVYVTNSTEILFLKDSKGGDHADTRRVVLSGFGTEDTHHIVHTLRWGPDGKLYFLQSLYIHSHLETPRGVRSLMASGAWRFDTRTLDLSIYSRGLVNPWGIIWDKWGQTFETDGAGGQGMNYAFPGAAFESAEGVERILPGLNPRSPKYCSEEMLTGRHIPDAYQGDVLTNDFRANRIVRFKLSDNGAGFTSRQMPDFLTSTDTAFRPVDIKMGPDGAIYIADWYNPIIQHGEVDFRDPRRDHVHGRIWRVTATGRALVARPKIAGATVSELLELLKAPEDYTRHQAKLELRGRKADEVVPAVKQWVSALGSNDAQADHDRLEALWVCENLNAVEPELLGRVLKSTEPRARAAGVRVAAHWAGQLPEAMKLIGPMVHDPFPRVRLEAVRALAAIPTPASIQTAASVLETPMDPVLEYGLWLTCNDLASTWVPAFQAGRLADWKPAQRNYALRAVKSPAALKVIVEQLKSGHATPAEQIDAAELLADIGGADEATALFSVALARNDEARGPVLAALLRMASRKVAAPSDAGRVSELVDDSNEKVRAAALRLAGAWKVKSLDDKLAETAAAEGTNDTVRIAAMDGLARMGDDASRTTLRKLSAMPTPAKIRRASLGGLASVDMRTAVRGAAEMIVAGDDQPGAILAGVLGREGAAAALATALRSATIPVDTAKLSLRYLQGSTTQDARLMSVFAGAVGSSTGPTRLTADKMKETMEEVTSKGDAANGERVFRRADTNCYQCHSIAGAGGWLAPDLSSIGAAAQLDYLINAVLDPAKDIKDGYDGYMVVTKAGDVYSGIKTLQDSAHLVLRDTLHQAIEIPLADVKSQRSVGSLMPTGLADPLTHQELLDLVKFLSELGKPGPYGPNTAQYIRRWQLTEASTLTNIPPSASAIWTTAYATVSGMLPSDAITLKHGTTVYARGEVDVTSPGKVRLKLNNTKGAMLSIDGRPAEISPKMDVELSRGPHVLLFTIDSGVRAGGGLQVEVADVPGSAGHGQAGGGR